ncbi:MAG TPA: hypothetical protein VIF38_02920 [Burkholderiales bacterium]
MSPSANTFLALCALGALSVSAPAPAANPGPAADAHQRYLEDRAACMNKSGDDRKTCLREAGAAQVEARRGRLTDPEASLEQNRLARCAYHHDAAERGYCERRMHGEGTVVGSVADGGILRELVVPVPAE